MIWNGTAPLTTEHDVAYRGWPTERVQILSVSPLIQAKGSMGFTFHFSDGRCGSVFTRQCDLIPLQEPKP